MDSNLKRIVNVQDGSTINCSLLLIVFDNLRKVSPFNKYLQLAYTFSEPFQILLIQIY